jgi:hypothetical protein
MEFLLDLLGGPRRWVVDRLYAPRAGLTVGQRAYRRRRLGRLRIAGGQRFEVCYLANEGPIWLIVLRIHGKGGAFIPLLVAEQGGSWRVVGERRIWGPMRGDFLAQDVSGVEGLVSDW